MQFCSFVTVQASNGAVLRQGIMSTLGMTDAETFIFEPYFVCC